MLKPIPFYGMINIDMNAYELADSLQETEPYYSTDYKLFDKVATMLRQQADRIAELEKCAGYYRDKYYLENTHPVKQLSDEEINDIYDMWQAMSGDPVKLYQLFKSKEITE